MNIGFETELNKAVTLFHNFDINKPIRVISHLDCDGLTSASILINALNGESRKHSFSIVTQLSKEKLKEIAEEDYEFYFFTDLGSAHVSWIEEVFKDKVVVILDHHTPEDYMPKAKNIIFSNPHMFGMDGATISGAGVTYLFTLKLNPKY